jgi:hypothetical protein
MSTIILVGVPLIVFTAIAICETEIVRIVKELINILVRTTNYDSQKIVQIIHLYF